MSPNAGGSSNVASPNAGGSSDFLSIDHLARKKIVRAVRDGKTLMFKTSEVEAFREAWEGENYNLD